MSSMAVVGAHAMICGTAHARVCVTCSRSLYAVSVLLTGRINKSGKLVLKLHKKDHTKHWQKLRALT